jgi:hypothetical protein
MNPIISGKLSAGAVFTNLYAVKIAEIAFYALESP